MRVGNQEQICVKLDDITVDELMLMSNITCLKKNRIINNAIRYYYMSSLWRSHNRG